MNVDFGEGNRTWIAGISTTFDIISKTAFHGDGIRKACWKQPFKYWMPIYINDRHANLAKRYFQSSIERIIGTSFKPTDVLTILPKLMCTMVVEVGNMKSHGT